MTRPVVSKDCLAGLMFVAIGLFGLWLGRDLEIGSAADMATGYFPRLMCVSLMALGGLLACVALLRGGDKPEPFVWRPLVLVTLASVAFGLLLKPLGLVLTILATVTLASFAGKMLRPLGLLLLAGILIAVNVGVFVLALRMPIPLWPALP